MTIQQILIIVISFIIIVYVSYIYRYPRELFQASIDNENAKQTFTTNKKNMKELLVKKADEIDAELMNMIISILEKEKEIPNNWQGIKLCIDAVDLTRAQKGNTGPSKKLDTEGYFVRLVNPERRNEMKCSYDISNRRIGVFDICDYHLVQAIANGYRLPDTDFDNYTIDFVPKNQWTNIEKLLMTDYDVMYAYIIPKSEFQKIIYSQRVYITGFNTMDISRINVFYPYITMRKTFMDDVYPWDSKNKPKAIYNRKNTVNLLWTSHYLFMVSDIKSTTTTTKSSTESFISRLTLSPEISDPSYRCYGELTNENRALCNSAFDPWGNPKKDQTYWDIPCIEDKECPFYKANKNYPNEFGKCQSNGICDFPVGVRRLAYVKYRDDFPYTPMCYGCSPDVLDCCQDQKDHPDKYPDLTSPDYAFSNDISLRAPRNLQTIIPML